MGDRWAAQGGHFCHDCQNALVQSVRRLYRSARRFSNLGYWHEMERGKHFAALEQQELFVREVRN
ncbi:MAG: hypothetical protein PUP91_32450 [Rhizonema sp. PD37]|nr:hypothetical protein [Rhizonema sp. PD37]